MTTKKIVDERPNIRVPADYIEKLERVCEHRGWTRAEFARRSLDREIQLIQREQSSSLAMSS